MCGSGITKARETYYHRLRQHPSSTDQWSTAITDEAINGNKCHIIQEMGAPNLRKLLRPNPQLTNLACRMDVTAPNGLFFLLRDLFKGELVQYGDNGVP